MKKTKILSAILCAAALTGAFAFSACGGNEGENTQNEHVPVTTVANEEEWSNAFKKFFLSDSLSAVCVLNEIYPDSTEPVLCSTVNFNLDYANGKFIVGGIVDSYSNSEYYEINDGVLYSYCNGSAWSYSHSSSGLEEIERYIPEATQAEKDFVYQGLINNEISFLQVYFTAKYCIGENMTESGLLMDFYSAFTYIDGYYVSNDLSVIGAENTPIDIQVKVAVKDGVLSEVECRYEDSIPSGQLVEIFTLTITGVNSTTVTAPDGARAAIDAKKSGQS